MRIRFPSLQLRPTHLPCPRLQRQRRARITRMVPKRRDPPLLALEEFHIIQHPPSPGVAAEHILPAALLLVAVRERDVDVFQREGVLVLEFLEADDDVVRGGGGPGSFIDERGAGVGEVGVVEDADGGPLDADGEAVFDERAGGGGGYWGGVNGSCPWVVTDGDISLWTHGRCGARGAWFLSAAYMI